MQREELYEERNHKALCFRKKNCYPNEIIQHPILKWSLLIPIATFFVEFLFHAFLSRSYVILYFSSLDLLVQS